MRMAMLLIGAAMLVAASILATLAATGRTVPHVKPEGRSMTVVPGNGQLYVQTKDGRIFNVRGSVVHEVVFPAPQPATRPTIFDDFPRVLTDEQMRDSTPAPRDLLKEAGIAPTTRTVAPWGAND